VCFLLYGLDGLGCQGRPSMQYFGV
jgi:hypothetical protein